MVMRGIVLKGTQPFSFPHKPSIYMRVQRGLFHYTLVQNSSHPICVQRGLLLYTVWPTI